MAAVDNHPPELRHRNLPLLLLQAREALMAQFRPLLNQQGLTDQQWRIVRALFDAETGGVAALEPRQLGEVCQISSPSIAGVLARMEELGLIARERMAGDQRRVAVSLTASSRKLAKKLITQVEARYAALEAEIGVKVMHEVYDLLDVLIGHLGAHAVQQDEAAAALVEPESAKPAKPAKPAKSPKAIKAPANGQAVRAAPARKSTVRAGSRARAA
jgi:homoprotocatechuate degradation regulator HpaR